MKLRKFSSALAIALFLTGGVALPAHAATKTNVVSAIEQAKVSDEVKSLFINAVQEANFTDKQLEAFVALVNEFNGFVDSKEANSIIELSAEDRASLLETVVGLAENIGLKAEVSVNEEGAKVLKITDAEGAELFTADSSLHVVSADVDKVKEVTETNFAQFLDENHDALVGDQTPDDQTQDDQQNTGDSQTGDNQTGDNGQAETTGAKMNQTATTLPLTAAVGAMMSLGGVALATRKEQE